MLKKLIATGLLLVFLLTFAFAFSACSTQAVAYSSGSRGEKVKEIQTKLKQWGYYKGNVDGIYGPSTVSAVKAFQKKHGITADGIVGSKTAEKIGISLTESSGGSSASASDTTSDVYLLARVVYGEARGESYKGQVAVAAVVLNRVKSSEFPNTIAKVVYQPKAFTIVEDGQINLTPDETALRAAKDAMNGYDPTGGAVFYYNPDKTSDKFMWSRPVITVIGNHRFCK